MADIVRHLEGAAQSLSWLYLVEEKRQPALAAAAFFLTKYADAARKAIDANDTEVLDGYVTLRLGTLAALLQVVRAHWENGVIAMTAWTADALAEIAHWIERAREAITQVLDGVMRAA
ncbi:hypothetical protein EKK97_14110 [Billgrantia tianxiuensis]|uniref:Uncharacterized protein n=1 Tax=Billgrantia tianxiuensis TaxID=2497861 RepID=A0A6I6SIZ0_9GAMM|nr:MULTISPECIES: hypothetical protein [Halomonas]MCE8034633.1 hypothetical protein [Halomonas sp. MCCC 1A11057]QHC50499.1 hypothetical protein EKK97_14110 [Halomonas tianxiuensis]